jgi:urease accessory protein
LHLEEGRFAGSTAARPEVLFPDLAPASGSPRDRATARPGSTPPRRAFRVGIGGPVGSGKTALVAALARLLRDKRSMAVVTNDIYTTEDADFLRRHAVLPQDRIVAVRTGCCPHTAVRDDISANLTAVETLESSHPDLELVLVESGGDNLTMTFSKGLVDVQVFVLDVSGGDKVPRKGGPGVTLADLLVVNKVDLAELVGADLAVMERDAAAVRDERPTLFTRLREDSGAAAVVEWLAAEEALWQRQRIA